MKTFAASCIICLLVAIGISVGGCDRGGRDEVRSFPLQQIKQVSFGRPYEKGAWIKSIDFAIDPAETIHLVWSIGRDTILAGYKSEMWYQQGLNLGEQWTSRVLVTERGDPARLYLSPTRIHVLAGESGRHYVSEDNGTTWTLLGGHLLPEDKRILTFDAVCMQETLLIACQVLEEEEGGKSVKRLDLIHWRPDQEPQRQSLASYNAQPLSKVGPRLLASGGKVRMIREVDSQQVRIGRGGEEIFSAWAQILYMESSDGGYSWSTPTYLPLAGDSRQPETPRMVGMSMPTAVFSETSDGLIVFYSSDQLEAFSSRDGARWAGPHRFVRQTVPGSPRYPYGAADATSRGDTLVVVWVDTRFRRNLLNWRELMTNPLRALMGSQGWINNDVFAVVWPRAVSGNSLSPLPIPTRLTPDLSFANIVRVECIEGTAVCMWSGRPYVSLDMSTPPGIFYVRLPIGQLASEDTP
jgi:hypothetical protein